jgi:hypothetical protein
MILGFLEPGSLFRVCVHAGMTSAACGVAVALAVVSTA